MRIGILNATGYSGAELVRFLSTHPEFEISGVTARSHAGEILGDVFPWLRAIGRPEYAELPLQKELDQPPDIVISCLPHTVSAETLKPFLESQIRCIDVSADFRLPDSKMYSRWHGQEHAAPEWLDSAVYGLTEFHREELRLAQLVANPGCHAGAAILALGPAARAGLLSGHVMVDSKTGVSGAGRSASVAYGFSEVDENAMAYGVSNHYQSPEISQQLSELGRQVIHITFVPHLVPMTRGILITAYASLTEGTTVTDVQEAYGQAYTGEAFVHLIDEPPRTKWAAGGNHAFVHWVLDEASHTLIAMAATDNLGKGAAGSAVQNANTMSGIDESVGLEIPPSYP